jgi:hypothetical protein
VEDADIERHEQACLALDRNAELGSARPREEPVERELAALEPGKSPRRSGT